MGARTERIDIINNLDALKTGGNIPASPTEFVDVDLDGPFATEDHSPHIVSFEVSSLTESDAIVTGVSFAGHVISETITLLPSNPIETTTFFKNITSIKLSPGWPGGDLMIGFNGKASSQMFYASNEGNKFAPGIGITVDAGSDLTYTIKETLENSIVNQKANYREFSHPLVQGQVDSFHSHWSNQFLGFRLNIDPNISGTDSTGGLTIDFVS